LSNKQNTKVKVIKPENIVFESDNRTNIIIDNGSTYILSHKNGICCCFDHEKKILRRVIKAIKRDGNFQVSNSNTMGFYIADNKGKMKYNLAQLVVCVAYNKKLQNIQHHNVKFIDGNILNYCIDNLDCTAIPNSRKVLCVITHNDRLIYVHCKFREKTGVLDYSPELFKILSLPKFRWTYTKKTNTITSPIYIHQEKIGNISLYQLAYICYNYENVNRRNILSRIKQFKLNCSKYELQVDHLDSDRLNERQYNLSLMDRIKNISKNNITAKFIYPYFHIAVYQDGIYKVAIGTYGNKKCQSDMTIQVYQCNTVDQYLSLLKNFFNKGLFPDNNQLPIAPKELWRNTSEKQRKHLSEVIPQIDKEKLLNSLLKADNLPLYVSGDYKRQ
jgi:hypothetical protein